MVMPFCTASHMLGRRVVMAGDRRARAWARHDLAPVLAALRSCRARPGRGTPRTGTRSWRTCPCSIASASGIEELALAGRMVVDRQQAEEAGRSSDRQLRCVVGRPRSRCRRCSARVMRRSSPRRSLDHACAVLHPVGVAAHVAQRQQIEHRGDAGGGDLSVVHHDRGDRRPFHSGARRECFSMLSVCNSTSPGMR